MDDEAGDRELRTDERGGLNPQGAVELGFRGERFGCCAKIGLRGEVGAVGVRGGIGGFAHPFGDGFGLAALDAGRFELAGSGERVEGGGGQWRCLPR